MLSNSVPDDHQMTAVPGEFVLRNLIAEFTNQVQAKVDLVLKGDPERLAKSLQRGEDVHFDQLLSSLGCLAEHCLPSLLETLFKWYTHQMPKKNATTNKPTQGDGKRSSGKSKGDINKDENESNKNRETAVDFVFCLVLIEILRQLPVHPLPIHLIRDILKHTFANFQRSSEAKPVDQTNARIVAELSAEAIGVLAQTKFQAVSQKFMYELHEAKKKEASNRIFIGLIMGMKFFRVKMYPVEDFEACFRFLQELADFSLEIKDREIKHAFAGLFVEILVPVAAAVKTEVNVPVLRDFVNALYPSSLEYSKRHKNKMAMYPLVTCLLCVSQKQFFLNNWHIFLDYCLSTLKSRDAKLSRVALESLYRLLWVYMVRIKCESNSDTQNRLQSIVKSLFPVGSRGIVPKDTPLNIFVKIIQFVAQERLDFAMKEIVLDLLSISLSSSRSVKVGALYPERMNIGLRAFLVITDSLQQKDGAPPMPSTIGVMPSGSTIRVKKTFLNKTLTEDEARTIGVAQYHKHVQKALDSILQALDVQVGQKMLLTNPQLSNKDPQELLTGDQKPKIELFRTCVAAIPRLMPSGISHADLLEMLSRLTVHVDDELRGRAFSALKAFAVDFPTLREDVVATFLSFVLKQVNDMHDVLLDSSLRMLLQLITAWKTNSSTPTVTSSRSGKGGHNTLPRDGSSLMNNDRKCIYAPLINRVEGFALVLLCSSRSMTRKLACHLLKETRNLAHVLNYGKFDDELCLDALDSLCPIIVEEVITQQQGMEAFSQVERENTIQTSLKKDIVALVEMSSGWHQQGGVHPWILFIAAFIEPERLPSLCPSAVSYSWPDVYIRLMQLQPHVDPTSASGNKKMVSPASGNEQYLQLWTNYLVFACRCAPTKADITHKQHAEMAVAAGTPDWLVALTRDSERLTASPSTLFQSLIRQLRVSDSIREAAVIGLGSTSIVGFPDLIPELETLIHEACEPKKQEDRKKKKKREIVRAVLAKVFSRLAQNKVLSQGVLMDLGRSTKKNHLDKVIFDYVDEMRSVLESQDRDVNVSTQVNSTFTSSLGSMSPIPHPAAATSTVLLDDLKFNFAEMITQLIRHMPLDRRSELFSIEIRKKLFFLFGSWCRRYDIDAVDASTTLLHYATLKAECAVLCCGAVFDKQGLAENGYILQWLETLLECSNSLVHGIGRETVVLLLTFNMTSRSLLAWLVGKCYTGKTIVANGCFLGIATNFCQRTSTIDCITLINLALFKISDPDGEVARAAEHLLIILMSQHLSGGDKLPTATVFAKNKNVIGTFSKFDGKSPPIHTLSQAKLSEEIARTHPEITMPIISEIFYRFPSASPNDQRRILEYLLPWLQNVELVRLGVTESNDARKNTINTTQNTSQTHPWLPMDGWGSERATMHIFNNLLYITTQYYEFLNNELEKCWSVLCDTWSRNLSVCISFLLTLQSIETSPELTHASKLVMAYLARSKTTRVTRYLIKESLIAEEMQCAIQVSKNAPYYSLMQGRNNNVLQVSQKSNGTMLSSPVEPTRRSQSAMNLAKPDSEHTTVSRSRTRTAEGYIENVLAPSVSSSHASHIRSSVKTTTTGPPTAFYTKRTPSHAHKNLSVQLTSSPKPTKPHHYLSLQQLNVSSDTSYDEDTHNGNKLTKMLRNRGSKKARTSNMSSSLSSSMQSLPVAIPTSKSSPQTKNRHSYHESLNPGAKLQSKYSSTRDLSLSDPVTRQKVVNITPSRPDKLSKRPDSSYTNAVLDHENIANYIQWRSCVEETSIPQALPLPSKETLLPLHTSIYDQHIVEIPGLLRCNIACIMLSVLITQHGIAIDWQNFVQTIVLSVILGMDQVKLQNVPKHCQNLLAHLMIKSCTTISNTQIACSVISSCLDSQAHTLIAQPLSSINFPALVSGYSKEDNRESSSADSGVSSPSSVSSSIIMKGAIRSMHDPLSSSSGISSPVSELTESAETYKKIKTSYSSTNFFIHTLITSKKLGWNHEDVSAKCLVLHSTEKLSSFVRKVADMIEQENPNMQVVTRLGKESLRFAVSSPNKHYRNRALQVFRALALPLPADSLAELTRNLMECVGESSDCTAQGHSIEILLTLLHACNMEPTTNKEETRQQRSRSFTPDLSWQMTSVDLPDMPESTSSSTSTIKKNLSPPTSPPQVFSPEKQNNAPLRATLPLSAVATATCPPPINSTSSPTTSRSFKKSHAHRRSGSVTLSKKMVADINMDAPAAPPVSSMPPPIPNLTATNVKHHQYSESTPPLIRKEDKSASSVHTTPQHTLIQSLGSAIHKTQSADAINVSTVTQSSPTVSSTNTGQHTAMSHFNQPVNATEEWKNMLAQIFWIGVALLESDFEHEFSLAIQLIEAVLKNLPLASKEGRFRIERYLRQIKWSGFAGLQNILTKGMTSSGACESTFQLLMSLTTVSNLPLVSGDKVEHGLAMNIMIVLPMLVSHFGEQNQSHCECAQNIAQVCLDSYKDNHKMQSLAHVMMLYSTATYGKPCQTWVSVVCKYVHETFPSSLQTQLAYLVDLLEKGPAWSHQPCLQIIYSLLSLSDLLHDNSSADKRSLLHQLLKSVSKHINQPKYWKEALNILKLAVSRSSEITSPTNAGYSVRSSTLGEMERIELPGRTLKFEYDMSNVPVVGSVSGRSVSHTNSTSPPSSGWKRPQLSQRKTREKLISLLPICGQHLLPANMGENVSLPSSPSIGVPSYVDSSLSTNTLDDTSPDFNEDKSEMEEDASEDNKGVDDLYVMRNFDFLDELEDNEDADIFTMHLSGGEDTEPGTTEDEPETYNLTPAVNTSQELENHGTIIEEDENSDSNSSGSSFSRTSSDHSLGVSNVYDNADSTKTDDDSEERSRNNSGQQKPVLAGVATLASSSESVGVDTNIFRSQSLSNVQSSTYIRTISPAPPEMYSKPTKKRNLSSKQSKHQHLHHINLISTSESDNDDKMSLDDIYDETGHLSHVLNDDICGTPPPPTDINSSMGEIQIAPPPPAHHLINSTVSHNVSGEFLSNTNHVACESSVGSSSSLSKDSIKMSSVINAWDNPTTSTSTPVPSPIRAITVLSSFSSQDFQPPWIAPTTFPPNMESIWLKHIDSVTTDNDGSVVKETFSLFPSLFKHLCIDFSELSKDGCKYLGTQLSKIARHFGTMVEKLPSQIQCPSCFASSSVIKPVLQQLKFSVLALQENLDTYNIKKKNTLQCLEVVRNIRLGNTENLSLEDQNISLEQKQLELCRLLYKLHFQLLLLFQSFNKIIQLITTSSPMNKNISDKILILQKLLLQSESKFRQSNENSINFETEEKTINSIKDALDKSLPDCNQAISSMHLLRKHISSSYPITESLSESVIKIHFDILEKNEGQIFAVLGSDDIAHGMCERLMEVNFQIQQSLRLLEVKPQTMFKSEKQQLMENRESKQTLL